MSIIYGGKYVRQNLSLYIDREKRERERESERRRERLREREREKENVVYILTVPLHKH